MEPTNNPIPTPQFPPSQPAVPPTPTPPLTPPPHAPNEQVTELVNPPVVAPPPTEPPKKKGISRVLVTIVLIAAALFIAAYAGVYIFMNDQLNKVTHTGQPSPTISTRRPTPTINPTANWQTYNNTELGFSIKHPSEFGSEKCPSGFGDTTNTLCTAALDDSPVEPLFYFIGFGQDQPAESVPGIGKINYRTEKINNVEVLRTTNLPSAHGAEYVFFKDNSGKYIQVIFTPYDETDPFPEQDKYKQMFDQMLATFKFL